MLLFGMVFFLYFLKLSAGEGFIYIINMPKTRPLYDVSTVFDICTSMCSTLSGSLIRNTKSKLCDKSGHTNVLFQK